VEDDLATLFATLAVHVEDCVREHSSCTFSPGILPVLPEQLSTDSLLVTKHKHDYNSAYLADHLRFCATKEPYSYLALLILSSLFHPAPATCVLHLINPKSDIKQIVVESPFYHRRGPHLTTVPQSFVYLPARADTHPFTHILPYTLLHDLPTFLLTNRENMIYAEHEWATRDTVVGFGSDLAHALLAELLLNASAPASAVSEIFLEGESGFRGVGPLSAEVSILLPGSQSWIEP